MCKLNYKRYNYWIILNWTKDIFNIFWQSRTQNKKFGQRHLKIYSAKQKKQKFCLVYTNRENFEINETNSGLFVIFFSFLLFLLFIVANKKQKQLIINKKKLNWSWRKSKNEKFRDNLYCIPLIIAHIKNRWTLPVIDWNKTFLHCLRTA